MYNSLFTSTTNRGSCIEIVKCLKSIEFNEPSHDVRISDQSYKKYAEFIELCIAILSKPLKNWDCNIMAVSQFAKYIIFAFFYAKLYQLLISYQIRVLYFGGNQITTFF